MAGPADRGGAEERELDALLAALWERTGADFEGYARTTVRRRLLAAAARAGGLAALRARALATTEGLHEVLDALCVSVTSMFREPDFFRALRARAVPRLRGGGALRVWHAGCATGEEVWSHAILLDEEGLGDRALLYGTDIAPAALATADRGELPLDRMREYTAAYQRAGGVREFSAYYAARGGGAFVRTSLRRRAVFGRHDLTTDPSIGGAFDAVFCRNVLMYLVPSVQERVQAKLTRAVRPGGILALGRGEALAAAVAPAWEELDVRHRIFVRRDVAPARGGV